MKLYTFLLLVLFSAAASAVEVYQCNATDFDPTTGACAAPYWSEAPSLLPGWTAAQLHDVTGAFLGFCAIAYLLHRVIKWAESPAV